MLYLDGNFFIFALLDKTKPNLNVVEVSPLAPLSALDFIEKYGLKPRHAFHLAIMREKMVETIVTDDKDFERVEWVKRIGY